MALLAIIPSRMPASRPFCVTMINRLLPLDKILLSFTEKLDLFRLGELDALPSVLSSPPQILSNPNQAALF